MPLGPWFIYRFCVFQKCPILLAAQSIAFLTEKAMPRKISVCFCNNMFIWSPQWHVLGRAALASRGAEQRWEPGKPWSAAGWAHSGGLCLATPPGCLQGGWEVQGWVSAVTVVSGCVSQDKDLTRLQRGFPAQEARQCLSEGSTVGAFSSHTPPHTCGFREAEAGMEGQGSVHSGTSSNL